MTEKRINIETVNRIPAYKVDEINLMLKSAGMEITGQSVVTLENGQRNVYIGIGSLKSGRDCNNFPDEMKRRIMMMLGEKNVFFNGIKPLQTVLN